MKRRSLVWKCFEDSGKDQAKCQLCGRVVPNKGKNTSNLRSHILHQHREQYEKVFGTKAVGKISLAKGTAVARKTRRRCTLRDSMVKKEPDESTSTSRCYEVLAEEVLKDFEFDEDLGEEQVEDPEIEDVWSYFEKLPSNRAQCILCKETFNRHIPFLTRHMKEKHRKVAWDQPSDSDEDQNCYTEVVYLEEEQPNVTKSKQLKQIPVIKKRRLSSRYEIVNKPKEGENTSKIDQIDDEIENFGRYVIGLLKKMPKDVSTQLQMDIIGMIMKAKLKLETTTEPVSASVSNVMDNVIVTPGNVIVTTPSNVIHTTQNNASLPTLVIGVEK